MEELLKHVPSEPSGGGVARRRNRRSSRIRSVSESLKRSQDGAQQ